MVKVGFWINDPSNIGKNFAETLQIEDLAVKKCLSILLHAYFCEKKIRTCSKNIFYEWGKNIKKHFVEKSFSVFKGAPLSPLNTL
jgi:hypothetical protein